MNVRWVYDQRRRYWHQVKDARTGCSQVVHGTPKTAEVFLPDDATPCEVCFKVVLSRPDPGPLSFR